MYKEHTHTYSDSASLSIYGYFGYFSKKTTVTIDMTTFLTIHKGYC